MESYKGINYQFRPDSYWVDKGIRQSILRDVKVPNDGPQIPNTSTNQNAVISCLPVRK